MCGKALIDKICQMLVFDWDVVVRHTYREANRLTDALAKHSFTVNEEVCSFQVCPDFCKHQLDADEKGLVTYRSVIA
jgi:hypothetical protein